MEKNTTKYFLGVAVVAIWGLLVFRIYAKMKPQNNFVIPMDQPHFTANENVPDTFVLSLNYSNPFKVGRVRQPQVIATSGISNNKPSKPKTNKVKTKKKNAPKVKVLPKVSYKGMIKLKHGRTAALLSVDGNLMNLGRNEKYENILLQKIYEDSIQLRFEGRDTFIVKGQ